MIEEAIIINSGIFEKLKDKETDRLLEPQENSHKLVITYIFAQFSVILLIMLFR